MQWVLENDVTDMDFTFSHDFEEFGVTKQIELKENGQEIEVTNDNKHEYVALTVQWRVTRGAEQQMNSFLKGFHEFVPEHFLKAFDEKELELVISGVNEIDVHDWERNTEYRGWNVNDRYF
jgi:E3 ubiquitin-protein ligase NEDD4